jgi:hypothetical protein
MTTHEQAFQVIKDAFPKAKIIAEYGKETMSNSTESPLSVTFRSPKGSLISTRGDDGAALAVNLQQLSEQQDTPDGPMSVIEMIAEIEAILGPTSAGGATAGSPNGSSAGAPAQASLNPACPTCGGSTTEKSGTSAKGPWKGYFCNSGDKTHKPQWA